MGLAPYGEPKYADAIRRELLDIKTDGSFWLNPDYFNFLRGTTDDKRGILRAFRRRRGGRRKKSINGTWMWRGRYQVARRKSCCCLARHAAS